jgi:hypothetical protein
MIRFAAFLLLTKLASATELAMVIVKQPLYLHRSDSDVQIRIVDVPVAYSTSYPESYFAAIHLPFTPASNGSWKQPKDVNMASVYGIKVSASEGSTSSIPLWKITIDASAAKQPDGYPFTIEQVIDATMTCIKVMSPPKPESEHKITIDVVHRKSKP